MTMREKIIFIVFKELHEKGGELAIQELTEQALSQESGKYLGGRGGLSDSFREACLRAVEGYNELKESEDVCFS